MFLFVLTMRWDPNVWFWTRTVTSCGKDTIEQSFKNEIASDTCRCTSPTHPCYTCRRAASVWIQAPTVPPTPQRINTQSIGNFVQYKNSQSTGTTARQLILVGFEVFSFLGQFRNVPLICCCFGQSEAKEGGSLCPNHPRRKKIGCVVCVWWGLLREDSYCHCRLSLHVVTTVGFPLTFCQQKLWPPSNRLPATPPYTCKAVWPNTEIALIFAQGGVGPNNNQRLIWTH